MKERKFKKINFALTLSVVVVLLLAMLGVAVVVPSTGDNGATVSDNLGTISLSDLPQGEESRSKSNEYEYLSDMEPTFAKIGWGSLKKDASPEDKPIALHVSSAQDTTYFVKGVGAHATSTLIYKVPEGKNYETFSAYLGVNADRGELGDVTFHIYTTTQEVSFKQVEHKKEGDKEAWTETVEDDSKNHWEEDASTKTKGINQRGNSVATKVDVNIKGKKYIKLVADQNGAEASDHAVYADAMFKVNGYDHVVNGDMPADLFDKVATYDTTIRNLGITDKAAKDKALLKRTYVNAIGYDLLKAYYNFNDEYKATIDWLATDSNALELYLSGGTPNNGNYGASLRMLNTMYQTYKDDFKLAGKASGSDVPEGKVYKNMVIATSLVFTQDINAFLGKMDVQPGEDEHIHIDPVKRYEIYRDLHKENKLCARIFDNLPIANMRLVLNSSINNDEIKWLNNFIRQEYHKKYNELTNKNVSADEAQKIASKYVLDSQTYVKPYDYYEENTITAAGGNIADRYKAPFRLSKYYTQETYNKWEQKSELSKYGITNDKKVARLYMLFNNDGQKDQNANDHYMGGLCGDVSNAGVNINSALGLPSVMVGQPGHVVYMQYREDINNQPHWHVGGYDKNGIEMSGSAGLLGWGSHGWKNRGYSASYLMLAQDAINTGAKYALSASYIHLANVYSGDKSKQEEIYKAALKEYNKNLDAWYGLIDTYIAMAKPESTFMAMAEEIVKQFKYYPVVMMDLIRLFDDTPKGVNIYTDEGAIGNDGKTVMIKNPDNIIKINNLKHDTIDQVIDNTFVRQTGKDNTSLVDEVIHNVDHIAQPEITNRLAWYIREWGQLDVATFSFADNTLKVCDRMVNQPVEYSVDGKTWKPIPQVITNVPGPPDKEGHPTTIQVTERKVVLSKEEVSKITEATGIRVRIQGSKTNQFFQVKFKKAPAISNMDDFKVDDENNVIVTPVIAFANYEWHSSNDPDGVWYGYNDKDHPMVFPGDCTVVLRIKSHTDVKVGKDVNKYELVNSGNGTPKQYHMNTNYLAGPQSKEFVFHTDTVNPYVAVDEINYNKISASSELKYPYYSDKALDLDEKTAWRSETKNKDATPYYVIVLNKPIEISGIEYLPEKGNSTGIITGIDIELGISKLGPVENKWGEITTGIVGFEPACEKLHFDWAQDETLKVATFAPVTVDYIKITMTKTSGDHAAVSEFKVRKYIEEVKPEPPKPAPEPVEPEPVEPEPQPQPVEPDPSEGGNQGGDTDQGGDQVDPNPDKGDQGGNTDQGNQGGDQVDPNPDKGDQGGNTDQGGESGNTDSGNKPNPTPDQGGDSHETPDKPTDGGNTDQGGNTDSGSQVNPTPDQGNQDSDVTPDADKPAEEGESKDNTGMIVGISIAVVLVVLFGGIILGVYIKKRRG